MTKYSCYSYKIQTFKIISVPFAFSDTTEMTDITWTISQKPFSKSQENDRPVPPPVPGGPGWPEGNNGNVRNFLSRNCYISPERKKSLKQWMREIVSNFQKLVLWIALLVLVVFLHFHSSQLLIIIIIILFRFDSMSIIFHSDCNANHYSCCTIQCLEWYQNGD